MQRRTELTYRNHIINRSCVRLVNVLVLTFNFFFCVSRKKKRSKEKKFLISTFILATEHRRLEDEKIKKTLKIQYRAIPSRLCESVKIQDNFRIVGGRECEVLAEKLKSAVLFLTSFGIFFNSILCPPKKKEAEILLSVEC